MFSLSNKANKIAREAVATSQKESSVRKEPAKGGKDWLEEMVTKQEILDRVGIVDPIIEKKVETTLSSISYKGKTKMEVTDDIVTDLERQIEKLRYQRVKMFQDQQKDTSKRIYGAQEDQGDPEEVAFRQALNEKNVDKMEDIVSKRKSKLEELERKYREKREMESMREAGLLDANPDLKSMYVSQHPPIRQSVSAASGVQRDWKASASPSKKITRDSKLPRIYPDREPEEDAELKDMIKRSEKLTIVDPRRSDFQKKLANYLVDKKLKNESSVYFEEKEKKKFERFKSPDSFKKSQEHLAKREITDFPLSHLANNNTSTNDLTGKENRQSNYQPSELNKVNKKKLKEINELFIIKLVFDALNHKDTGLIAKEEVLDYVMSNQDIVTIFDLKSSFNADILNFKSLKDGYLNFQELSKLMMKRLPTKTQKDIKSAFPQEKPKVSESHNEPGHPDTLLKEDEIAIFRTVFDELDRYEDFLIKTEVYLKALRSDLRVEKLLDKPAIRIPVVNRELTVRDILAQIDTDVESAIDSGINTMQYISWNQFIDYFKNYKTSKFTRQPQAEEKEEEAKPLLSEMQMQIIQDVFDMLPRAVEDYVDKIEFVKAAKRDPQVHLFWKQKVENEDEEEEGKQITVGELFDKILLSELNYLKWEDVLPFFSQQSQRNVSQGEEGEMEDFQGQTLKSEFPTFAPDHISEAAKEDDEESYAADESSPVKKVKGKSQNQQERKNAKGQKAKERDPKGFEDLDAELRKEYEQLQVDLRAYGVAQKNMKDEKGLTIPKPFKFQNSKEEGKVAIRQAKVQKMVDEKVKEEDDAISFKFKANPLPAYVKVPMYNALVKAQEEKRQDVVEKSKQLTLANQKPFSFAERDANKEKPVPKEESFQQFKANPVPQYVQVEMMKEKEEKDKKEREERIKKRMEDNAMSSKMPSRMEAAEKAKAEGTVKKLVNPKKWQPEEFNYKPNINKDVPDYEQLNQEFNEKLQKKKKDRPKTEAKPFSFQGAITDMVSKMVETDEMKRRNSNKQAPQIKKKQSAPAKQQKPKRKATEEEEEENNNQEEENQGEEEYPADEDQGGEEENNDNGDGEGGDNENENENENDMFQVEEEEGGDQSVNPMALKKQAPKPTKKAKEEVPEEEEEKVSVKSGSNKTMSQAGRSTQGDNKKKGVILTKKLEQEFEKRKKEKEARDKRFEDMKKEEQDRTQKKKDFAPKVKSAYNTVNKVDKREEENARRIRDAKDRMKQEQSDYNDRIKEMKNKVNTAPLMIEKRTYGSRLLERYRSAINKGWSTLEGPEDEQQNTVQSTGKSTRNVKRQPTVSENNEEPEGPENNDNEAQEEENNEEADENNNNEEGENENNEQAENENNEEEAENENNEEQQVEEENEEKAEEPENENNQEAENENNEEAAEENNNEEEENNNNEEEGENNNNEEEENNENNNEEDAENNDDENKEEEGENNNNDQDEDEYKDEEFENNDE